MKLPQMRIRARALLFGVACCACLMLCSCAAMKHAQDGAVAGAQWAGEAVNRLLPPDPEDMFASDKAREMDRALSARRPTDF